MLSPINIRLAQLNFIFRKPMHDTGSIANKNLEKHCAARFDFEKFRETYIALLEDLDFRYQINRGCSISSWIYDSLVLGLIAETGCTYAEAHAAIIEMVDK